MIGGYAQTFQWAKKIGNTGLSSQNVNATTTDASGNTYLTGMFSGTVDFDPGGAVFNLTSNSGSTDIFVCKLNTSGNLVWAKSFSGSSPDWPLALTTDATGNVYVAGLFQGTVDFDPNGGVHNITTLGGTDGIVCKLNSAGNFVSAWRFGSTGVDRCTGVAIDASGYVFISGMHASNMDADPGLGTFTVGGNGSFLIKLGSAGNFNWVRPLAGFTPIIALDGAGNVYVAGDFSGSDDFDPSTGVVTLTSAGYYDVFVCKFNNAGSFLWARRIGGTGNESVVGIAVDGTGNINAIGNFDGACDFDPGAGVYNLTSIAMGMAFDAFIFKLNAMGNFVWAKAITSNAGVLIRSIDIDVAGNVYTIGSFSGTVDFNPGTGTYNLVAATGTEVFLLKLSAAGNFLWAYDLSTSTAINGFSITIDPIGSIIVTGAFSGTGDFNPYSGVYNLTSTGNLNIFVIKLYLSPLPVELLSFYATQINESVHLSWQTASEHNNDFFTIEKSSNAIEFNELQKVKGAVNSSSILNYSYTDAQPYKGTTYYRLKQTDYNGSFMYSKIVAVQIKSNGELLIYQNQQSSELVISLTNQLDETGNLVILDLAGRVVYEQQVNVASNILISSINPGIYVAYIYSDNQTLSKKFMVQ